MRRNFGMMLLGLVLAAVVITGCTAQRIPAFWASEKIVIDGKMDDWAELPGTFADKLSTIILLKNDNDNIYFLMMFSDVQKLSLALRNGFTVWVDKSNNKKKGFIIATIGTRRKTASCASGESFLASLFFIMSTYEINKRMSTIICTG